MHFDQIHRIWTLLSAIQLASCSSSLITDNGRTEIVNSNPEYPQSERGSRTKENASTNADKFIPPTAVSGSFLTCGFATGAAYTEYQCQFYEETDQTESYEMVEKVQVIDKQGNMLDFTDRVIWSETEGSEHKFRILLPIENPVANIIVELHSGSIFPWNFEPEDKILLTGDMENPVVQDDFDNQGTPGFRMSSVWTITPPLTSTFFLRNGALNLTSLPSVVEGQEEDIDDMILEKPKAEISRNFPELTEGETYVLAFKYTQKNLSEEKKFFITAGDSSEEIEISPSNSQENRNTIENKILVFTATSKNKSISFGYQLFEKTEDDSDQIELKGLQNSNFEYAFVDNSPTILIDDLQIFSLAKWNITNP